MASYLQISWKEINGELNFFWYVIWKDPIAFLLSSTINFNNYFEAALHIRNNPTLILLYNPKSK
jgi:hypothetical protein